MQLELTTFLLTFTIKLLHMKTNKFVHVKDFKISIYA